MPTCSRFSSNTGSSDDRGGSLIIEITEREHWFYRVCDSKFECPVSRNPEPSPDYAVTVFTESPEILPSFTTPSLSVILGNRKHDLRIASLTAGQSNPDFHVHI